MSFSAVPESPVSFREVAPFTNFGCMIAEPDTSLVLPASAFDYAADAIGLLLSQFRDKPKFAAWFDLHSGFATEIESQYLALNEQRTIAAAVGVQQDAIGAWLGVAREGLDDSEYRIFLTARAAVIGSNSSIDAIESVLAIFAAGFGLSLLRLRVEPDTLVLHCTIGSWQQILGNLFAEQLATQPSAGTRLILEFEPPELLFRFEEYSA